MVKFLWRHRFGNQLFQYCLGRILHREFGVRVEFPPHFYKDEAHAAPYDDLWRPQSQSGDALLNFRRFMSLVDQRAFIPVHGQRFDPALLKKNRPLLLSGWFQRYEYYQPHKELIRKEWLPLPSLDRVDVHPDDLHLHIRRRDYVIPHTCPGVALWATPLLHLERAIGMFSSWRRMVVISDDPDDPFMDHFRNTYGAEVKSGSMTEDFLTLAAAKKLIISESTFAWWAAFLGRAERIVCPIRKNSFWNNKHVPEMNLIVHDESRFEFPLMD